MKDLGKFILVQMYDRLKNENVQSSKVSQYDLLYQIQNVYGNLTNFTHALTEEDFNFVLNELLRQNSVQQQKRDGWIYYQLTGKGREQAWGLMTQLQRHKHLQREPVSKPLAGYRRLEPNRYKSTAVIFVIIIVVALIGWYWRTA
ncbi:MAG: hypothetical protein M3X11_08085 [Acidobacteriota bacterium]|nr:hypothetical protein [Acidobacteriota bacterium]